MAQPSNKKLEEQILEVKQDVKTKHSSVMRAIRMLKGEMVLIRDYIKYHDGYEAGKKEVEEAKKTGVVSISPEVWKLLAYVITGVVSIAVALVGAEKVLK